MKVLKWMGTLAVAVSLLTSCLGESDNRFTRQGFGVAGVSDKSYKTVVYTSYGPMYSPNLVSQVADGACYTLQYEVDLNAPENKTQTMDYYTATITIFEEVTKGNAVFYNVPDTATASVPIHLNTFIFLLLFNNDMIDIYSLLFS